MDKFRRMESQLHHVFPDDLFNDPSTDSAKMTELQEEKSGLESALRTAEAVQQYTLSKLADTETLLDETKLRLNAAVDLIAELQLLLSVDSSEELIASVKRLLSAAQARRATPPSDIEPLEKKCQQLQRSLDATQAEANDLRNHIAIHEQTKKDLLHIQGLMKSDMEEIQSRLERAQAKYSAAELRLDEVSAEVAELRQLACASRESDETMAKLENDYVVLSGEYNSLQDAHQKLTAVVGDMKVQITALEERNQRQPHLAEKSGISDFTEMPFLSRAAQVARVELARVMQGLSEKGVDEGDRRDLPQISTTVSKLRSSGSTDESLAPSPATWPENESVLNEQEMDMNLEAALSNSGMKLQTLGLSTGRIPVSSGKDFLGQVKSIAEHRSVGRSVDENHKTNMSEHYISLLERAYASVAKLKDSVDKSVVKLAEELHLEKTRSEVIPSLADDKVELSCGLPAALFAVN